MMQDSQPFTIGPEQQKALSKSFIGIHTLKTESVESAKDFSDVLSWQWEEKVFHEYCDRMSLNKT